VSGTYCQGAGGTPLNPVVDVGSIDYPPEFNIPEPTITCSGNGSMTAPTTQNNNTITVSPGNFGAQTINHTGPVIFRPGNYCFNGNFHVNGTAQIVADYVRFKMTSGEFSTNGVSRLTCNDMLVHIDGGSGVRFNGGSRVDCNNVTFFASTGDISWSGNATVRMFAPEGGDYKNLLIYMPYGNNSDLTITGNTNNELKGSIFAISSNIRIAGNSGTEGLHSQIVGYTVTLEGNSNTIINYVPEEQYWVVNPSGVTLTK
jgi:hypothetical protein